jgi:hypothetical protein
MNCQEFWNRMPELDAGAAGVSDHTRECPACAALLRQQRTIAQGLQAMRQDWRSEQAPARLEARLASAFRSHNGLSASPPRIWWTPLLTWAAATAIILLAIFLLRERQPQPAQHRVPSRIELAAVPLSDSNGGWSSVYTEAGFVPLPDADEIEPNDDVNYVRMELPRSRMAALGFALNPEHASELVEAEVLLGADGMARAVRILDE